jgi:hypothetical protein
MIKSILLILSLVVNTMVFATTFDTIPANNPLLEYSGRVDFTNKLAPQFSYSGVSIRASFQGTSIAVILNDVGTQNYYNIIIDSKVITRIQTIAGTNTYTLANGLKDTIHEIEIYKLTEQCFGITKFLGYIIDKGKTLVPISNKRDRIIEFIGNSITCGFGNEGSSGDSFGPTTENNYLTYGAFTCRNLKARYFGVCVSGIGLYHNYGATSEAANYDCMFNYYNRTIFVDSTPLYSNTPRPDLICVDLGTNDFSAGGGDTVAFVSKYFKFIDSLQYKNKSADIICLVGPMVSGSTLDELNRLISNVVDSANKKNNGKVYFFELSHELGDLGYGIAGHPTVAQHNKNANELTAFIESIEQWSITPIANGGTTANGKEIVLSFNTEMSDSTAITGLSLIADSTIIPIVHSFVDSVDATKIHCLLANPIKPEQKLLVSYSSGTIESMNNIKALSFDSVKITNNLSCTNIVNASINTTGKTLSIVINKTIETLANANGITVFDSKNNILVIDSFAFVNKTTITLYLNEKVKVTDSIYLSITDSTVIGQDLVSMEDVTKYNVTMPKVITAITITDQSECLIYPNPSFHKTLKYTLPQFTGFAVAKIYNLQGIEIFTQKLNAIVGEIDLHSISLSNGCYLVTIITDQRIYSKIVYIYSSL